MKFRALSLILILSLLTACGGGSAGTGLGPAGGSIEGRVSIQGKPLSNAVVTVVETGDTGQTDPDGLFLIEVSNQLESYTLEVNYEQKKELVAINTSNNSESSVINLEIDIPKNPAKPLTVDYLQVEAKIVGICDIYFDNTRPIRQSNPAPPGIECTAKVRVSSGYAPVGQVSFAVQHKSCDDNSEWITDAASETSETYFPGIGQLQFSFFDDYEHCIYRIITPFEDQGIKPVTVEVQTLTSQNFKK